MKKLLIALFFVGITGITFGQSKTTIITVDAAYSKTSTEVQVYSSELNTFIAHDQRTGLPITVYSYNNFTGKASPALIPFITITQGWGLYGDCWEYGTFWTAPDGTVAFNPCGGGCEGFPKACPDAGNGMVRFSFQVLAP